MEDDMYIHSFRSFLPANNLPQKDTVDWILSSHLRNEVFKKSDLDKVEFLRKLRRFTVGDQHISRRYFESNDVSEEWGKHRIYRLLPETPEGASIGERNKFFAERALEILKEAYPESVPAHLVHVTCTGYMSPSPPQRFFGEKGSNTRITHAYHMGCYASLPAIRMAAALAESEKEGVDVFHTEMCSLHLNSAIHTPEQMVVQTLFADGHIVYTVGNAKEGFKLRAILERLVPDSHEDMVWFPDSNGMSMTLSREVPLKIRDMLPEFLKELASESGYEAQELIKNAMFAIHPGGPKIIEAVQKKLELREEQVSPGKKILLERGNMSSATLPHVWQDIWENHEEYDTVVSLAFGPGLTIFGAVFEVRR